MARAQLDFGGASDADAARPSQTVASNFCGSPMQAVL